MSINSSTKSILLNNMEDDQLPPEVYQVDEKKPFIERKDSNISADSVLHSIYNETEWKCPEQRFLIKFPISLERRFQVFDDFLIRTCQVANSKMWAYFDLLFTGMVAIEMGIAAPFILFVLGKDSLAIEMSYLMLVLCVLSQIPKRFLWRYRPYMVGRALKMRDKETAVTSSFPSRAVTCGVVYSYFICYAYVISSGPITSTDWHFAWWMPILFIFTVLIASFARVNLGVHYPSDCVAGFLQGLVVCIIGTIFWSVNTLGCKTCDPHVSDNCYSTGDEAVTSSNVHKYNWVSLLVTLVIGLLITLLSIVKPVNLWDKCDRVYGMIFPCIAFQLTLLCPSVVKTSLPEPRALEWYSYIYAFGVSAVLTVAAFKNSGRYPLISFFVLFCATYTAIAVWRIYIP